MSIGLAVRSDVGAGAAEEDVTTLIVGATGVLGRTTALTLLAQGQRVRALVREPVRQPAVVAELQRAGAEVASGDLTDAASLERACKGALRIFVCAHSMHGRGAQRSAQVDHVGHSALLAAAMSAGVPRIVYTSDLRARDDHPIDFFRTKFELEHAVRDSTIPYTILRPAPFMEQGVHDAIGRPLLEHGFAVIVGGGDTPRNFVAAADVAAFAVLALQGDTLLRRTLDIGGPDNVSRREIAALYTLRAKQGRVFHAPLALTQAAAMLLRPWHEGFARALDIAAVPVDDPPEVFDATALLAEFGRDLTTVDRFVDERVREWRRSRVGRR
jgi:uncharacterized protein YbjT (DUF2867 family)